MIRNGKSEKEPGIGLLRRCADSHLVSQPNSGLCFDYSYKHLIELRVQHFDMLFIRLLHLLAHHPDFAVTTEGLQDMAK
jgi:hypothetical protein